MINQATSRFPGMARAWLRVYTPLLFVFLGFLPPRALHAETTQPFLFFYSSNVQGEIEPCG